MDIKFDPFDPKQAALAKAIVAYHRAKQNVLNEQQKLKETKK